MSITNYPNLRNKNGTIYDKATGKQYANPAQLATDLGISPDKINWGAIANETITSAPPVSYTPSAASSPAPQMTFYKDGKIATVNASQAQYYLAAGYSTTPPAPASTTTSYTPAPVAPKFDTGDKVVEELLATGDENSEAFAKMWSEGIKPYFDMLVQQGKIINPQVDISEEQAAQFLSQAQKEISPYYDTQMKLAREGLLRIAGYTSDEIAQQEAQLERGYGRELRGMGETAAESGMALSGGRQLSEQELAQSTQETIDQNRKLAEYNMGSQARQFAGEWGGEALPAYSYGAAPKVQAGVSQFGRSLDTKPFYNISDSVYQGLVGSKQYEQKTAENLRQSELIGAERTRLENDALKKARTLSL